MIELEDGGYEEGVGLLSSKTDLWTLHMEIPFLCMNRKYASVIHNAMMRTGSMIPSINSKLTGNALFRSVGNRKIF